MQERHSTESVEEESKGWCDDCNGCLDVGSKGLDGGDWVGHADLVDIDLSLYVCGGASKLSVCEVVSGCVWYFSSAVVGEGCWCSPVWGGSCWGVGPGVGQAALSRCGAVSISWACWSEDWGEVGGGGNAGGWVVEVIGVCEVSVLEDEWCAVASHWCGWVSPPFHAAWWQWGSWASWISGTGSSTVWLTVVGWEESSNFVLHEEGVVGDGDSDYEWSEDENLEVHSY